MATSLVSTGVKFPDDSIQITAAQTGLGVGQTWQTVTRSINTWYQNTTGKPIAVFAYGSIAGGVSWDIGPNTTSGWITLSMNDQDSGDSADYGWVVVPNNYYYRNTLTWNNATELR